jgi:hypothetical protein
MGKKKRVVLGSVVKSKTPSDPDYIKIKSDFDLKAGQILRLESAKSQLASLDEAVKSGKISEDFGGKVRERIEKIPDWVRFEIIALVEE